MLAVRAASSICAWLAEGRPSAMLSRTLAWIRRTSCSTKPMRRYSAVLSSCRRSAPPSVMRPLVGSKKRSSSRASVDFPAPDGPTTAVTVPGASVKLRFDRA